MNLKLAKQRIKRGYNDEDVWNLDNYFLEVFIPALKQLRDTKHGIPTIFCYDEDGNEIDDDVAEKAWNTELNKMIGHFEAIQLYDGDGNENQHHIDEGMKLFAKYFTCLWD